MEPARNRDAIWPPEYGGGRGSCTNEEYGESRSGFLPRSSRRSVETYMSGVESFQSAVRHAGSAELPAYIRSLVVCLVGMAVGGLFAGLPAAVVAGTIGLMLGSLIGGGLPHTT